METNSNMSQVVIETINTIFSNLFKSIDTNLFKILDNLTFINSNIFPSKMLYPVYFKLRFISGIVKQNKNNYWLFIQIDVITVFIQIVYKIWALKMGKLFFESVSVLQCGKREFIIDFV